MENLRQLAEEALAETLEDVNNGFGLPIELFDPDGNHITETNDGRPLAGQVLRDSFTVYPDTGAMVIISCPIVVLRISSLPRVPKEGETWIVRVPSAPMPDASKENFVFDEDRPPELNRSLGIIKLFTRKGWVSVNFIRVKQALISNVLAPKANGRFRIVDAQRQAVGSEEIEDDSRLLMVYYSAGDFRLGNASRVTGPTNHDLTFKLDFSVSAGVTGNLNILQNQDATPEQISAAIRSLGTGSAAADDLMDEFFALVYQIVMDPVSYDMGLPKGFVVNRWMDNFTKDNPEPKGDLVVLTAQATLTCRVSEDFVGDISGRTGGNILTKTEIDGDNVQETGVQSEF